MIFVKMENKKDKKVVYSLIYRLLEKFSCINHGDVRKNFLRLIQLHVQMVLNHFVYRLLQI